MTHQHVHAPSQLQQNQHSSARAITEVVKNPTPGAWIRLQQPDGNYKFVWNSKISTQAEVDKLYPEQDATYVGKGKKVIGAEGINYVLMPNGEARIVEGEEDHLRAKVPPETVVGRGTPQRAGGAFNIFAMGCNTPSCNFRVSANFIVSNLSEDEKSNIRIIQFVTSPVKPQDEKLGSIDGKLAFVDGGTNSERGRDEPWYGTADDSMMQAKHNVPTGYQITLSDTPVAIIQKTKKKPGSAVGDKQEAGAIGQPYYPRLDFESYIVVENYNGSGKIKILAMVEWGFRYEGEEIVKTIENPVMISTNSFSGESQKIWENDYGGEGYEFVD